MQQHNTANEATVAAQQINIIMVRPQKLQCQQHWQKINHQSTTVIAKNI